MKEMKKDLDLYLSHFKSLETTTPPRGEKKEALALFLSCFKSLATTSPESRKAICGACVRPFRNTGSREITGDSSKHSRPPSPEAYLLAG